MLSLSQSSNISTISEKVIPYNQRYIVKKPSIAELEICVDMYLAMNDETFIPASKVESLKALIQFTRQGQYVKACYHNDELIAWLYAVEGRVSHMNFDVVEQKYYACSKHGVQSFNAIKALHADLVAHAERLRYPMVISQGSPFDKDNVYARILEKNGWERRGFLAVYKTKYYANIIGKNSLKTKRSEAVRSRAVHFGGVPTLGQKRPEARPARTGQG